MAKYSVQLWEQMPSSYSVGAYLTDLRSIRATGSATAETSFYPPLDRLFNAAGKDLKPAVLFSTQLRNQGAGMPDTIVCNGLGGISVQIAYQQDPGWVNCVYPCLWAHEESHARDAISANPAVCYRAAAGVQVTFSNGQERKSSEYAAWTIEIECLKALQKQKCPKCKNEDVPERIRILKKGLKQFQ